MMFDRLFGFVRTNDLGDVITFADNTKLNKVYQEARDKEKRFVFLTGENLEEFKKIREDYGAIQYAK